MTEFNFPKKNFTEFSPTYLASALGDRLQSSAARIQKVQGAGGCSIEGTLRSPRPEAQSSGGCGHCALSPSDWPEEQAILEFALKHQIVTRDVEVNVGDIGRGRDVHVTYKRKDVQGLLDLCLPDPETLLTRNACHRAVEQQRSQSGIHGHALGTLTSPKRPSRKDSQGDEQEQPGGGGGGGPEGDLPPGSPPKPWPKTRHWPYNYDCTVPYKAAPLRIARSCAKPIIIIGPGGLTNEGWTRDELIITAAHYAAYKVALTALRTVTYIRNLFKNNWGKDWEQVGWADTLWNWGVSSSPLNDQSYFWNDSPSAKYASLAWWFGDYQEKTIDRIYTLFFEMVKYYENGAVSAVAGNHPTYSRKPVIYWCSHLGVVGRHPIQRETELGSHFFLPHSHKYRARAILHENMHNLLGVDHPNDEWNLKCHAEKGHKCYAVYGYENWTFGEQANNPRILVETYQIGEALDNIDNFVSWACRRWDDPQWGPCNAPRPPVGWIERKGRV